MLKSFKNGAHANNVATHFSALVDGYQNIYRKRYDLQYLKNRKGSSNIGVDEKRLQKVTSSELWIS